ncbi:hypothetical protein M0534_06745 [Methylonatrum kenyense]|uniref:hypothetical protein n=1 Tax=Methylonatrum kenyense TaxID=455253 RepID=UPI0020C01451|nr:hypothetical protein [Methylonatrum kenyense]MCK8516022.1 hypothetical protein [Methylonatrum kenyense]
MWFSNLKSLLMTLLLALGLTLGGMAPAIAADGEASSNAVDDYVVEKDGDEEDDLDEWDEEDEYGW